MHFLPIFAVCLNMWSYWLYSYLVWWPRPQELESPLGGGWPYIYILIYVYIYIYMMIYWWCFPVFLDARGTDFGSKSIKIQGSTRIGFPKPWKAAISCQDHQATAVDPTASPNPCGWEIHVFLSFLFGYPFQYVSKGTVMHDGCLHAEGSLKFWSRILWASHCTASNQHSEYLHIFTCLISLSSMASRKMGLSHAYIA